MKFWARVDGIPETTANLRRIRDVARDAARESVPKQANYLFGRTRAIVPYLEGELYASAYQIDISTEKQVIWAVGYDTTRIPYAWEVHEIPNRIHPTRGPSPEPKQDHFLSEPRDAMEQSYVKTVGDDIRRAIAGVRIMAMRRR